MNKKIIEKAKESSFLKETVSLFGNSEAVIDNCKRIIECNEILVKVKTEGNTVSVWGTNLKIVSSQERIIRVIGKIDRIELESSGRKL